MQKNSAWAAERLPKWGGGGGTNKKGCLISGGGGKSAFWRKKGKSQSDNIQFFYICIYPYVEITLSGMISIFVSFYTPYKLLLRHHTLQLGVMV